MKKYQKIILSVIICTIITSASACLSSSNKSEKPGNTEVSKSDNSPQNPDYARPGSKKEGTDPLNKTTLDASSSVPSDKISQRIYSDYGAILRVQNGAKPPPTLIFSNENECLNWQSTVNTQKESIGGISIELQQVAMQNLLKARDEAKQSGVDITPRGSDAARRSYADTVRLWTSRVTPGLDYWLKKGRLDSTTAAGIRSLSPNNQVGEILNLENQGMNFSTDFSKSILYSVAAPGTSQHLSMLALDVNQHENAKVREILARNGWFQTVVSDLPHFTYLGVQENQLTSIGLRKTVSGGRSFWVP